MEEISKKEKHSAYMREWNKKNPEKKKINDKQSYEKTKERGICVRCRTNPAEEGFLKCGECHQIVLDKQTAWRSKNREHVNEQAKKYKKPYSENRESRRMSGWYGRIKSKYGWTKEKVASILENQNHLCAICKQPNSKEQNWSLDHDHQTGFPREFLCHRCNSILGYANDSIELLETSINYLKRHKDTPNELPVRYEGWADNGSGYEGVEKNHNKWAARVMINKKRYYIGNFDTPQEAYTARYNTIEKLRGPLDG